MLIPSKGHLTATRAQKVYAAFHAGAALPGRASAGHVAQQRTGAYGVQRNYADPDAMRRAKAQGRLW